nr:MAG TPA: hypothetical protein [Caudoviricetes sp.]
MYPQEYLRTKGGRIYLKTHAVKGPNNSSNHIKSRNQ